MSKKKVEDTPAYLIVGAAGVVGFLAVIVGFAGGVFFICTKAIETATEHGAPVIGWSAALILGGFFVFVICIGFTRFLRDTHA